jgi:hypothetical protein
VSSPAKTPPTLLQFWTPKKKGSATMGVLDNLKDAAKVLRENDQTELYNKVSAAEDEVRDILREKRRLEDKVEELERGMRFKEETVFKPPFYYLKQGDQTPYCPRCWEKDRQAVHVQVNWHDDAGIQWGCPDCKTNYTIRAEHRRRHQIEPEGGVWS